MHKPKAGTKPGIPKKSTSPFFSANTVFPKLTINAPGDQYEQEADFMADQVMRMGEMDQHSLPEAKTETSTSEVKVQSKAITPELTQKIPTTPPSSPIQNKEPEDDEKLQKEEQKEGEENTPSGTELQRQAKPDPPVRPVGAKPGSGNFSIYPKLKINPPNDRFEQEADAMADKVMRKTETKQAENDATDISLSDTKESGLQLKCMSCEEEEIHRKAFDDLPVLMRKSSAGGMEASAPLQSELSSSKGKGRPLPSGTLTVMNKAFQADFSGVRIHTGSQANAMSGGIQAKAFTHGSDIYFNSGQFNPQASTGKHLLAHELTHVVQQKGGSIQKEIQRKPTNNPPLNSLYFNHPFFREINEDDKNRLKSGDKGPYVKILQEALLDLKYPLPKFKDDGEFGKETKKALISYQQDVGFEGDDVDGILGQKTLRKLDTRFAASGKKNFVSTGGGSYVLIRIPIERVYEAGNFEDMQELAILQLQTAFSLSRDEANKLVPQTEDEVAEWKAKRKPGLIWWEKFGGVTEAEKELGYADTGLSKSVYEEYRNRAANVRGKSRTPEEVEKETRENLYKLQGKKKLYQLYKEIQLLREVLTFKTLDLGSYILDTFEDARRYVVGGKVITTRSDLQADLAAKELALKAELDRLGISEKDFFADVSAFRKSFQTYAVLTAIRMLDRNETKTKVANSQLKDLANIQDIKKIIGQLNTLYEQAEDEWWKGISLALTKDYSITGRKDLDRALNVVIHGIKGIPLFGTTLTTIESVYSAFAIYRYKDGKNGFLNEHFRKAQEAEQLAHLILAAGAQKYNILAYPDLDLKGNGKAYAKMGDQELQTKLNSYILNSKSGVLANIAKMKQSIQDDPEKIWELQPVWTQALRDLGLSQEDPQYQIIEAEVKRRKDAKSLRDILLAIGGIALGLLALASGPLGWAALAGSIVVGSIDAYIQYQEISFLRTARRTALDPKDALSDVDPSWVWFYLSLAGIALDFLDVIKVIKVANTVKKADNLIAKVGTDLSAEISRLKSLGKLDEAAKIEKLLANLEANKAVFAQNLKILLKLESDPAAMLRLSEVMAKKEVAEAVIQLGKHLGDTNPAFLTALKFYGGIGNDLAEELPEVVKLIKNGSLKAQPELMQEVLSTPGLQKVLLDHPHDPGLLVQEWKTWVQAGRKNSFVSHLQKTGYATELKKGASIINDFGKGFAGLSDLAKNRQLLRHMEPKLMDALDADLLPPQVKESILLHLSDDLIGETDDLARAGQRIREVIAPLIGGELKTNQEFAELAKLISDPGFLKRVFENAPNLPGKDTYARILQELVIKHQPAPDVMEQLARIGVVTDKDTLELLITNKGLREALAANPEAVKILKKCASPCFPTTLSGDQVLKINQLLSGKSLDGDQFRRLNEYIYLHREILEKGQFDQFFTHLEKHFDLIRKGKLSSIPKAELLVDPSKLVALGLSLSSAEAGKIASALKTAFPQLLANTNQKTLRSIFQRGIPEPLMTDILTIAGTKGKSAAQVKELVEQINVAAGIAYNGEMRQLGKVFYGLSEAKTFDSASSFLDIMKDYKSVHAEMFDDILTRMDWNDLARFPVPSGIQAPYYLRTVAHFKSLMDNGTLLPQHIEVIAQKLAKSSGGINMDDLLELHRVLSSSTFRRAQYRIDYIKGKLLNVNQNLKQFIEQELRNKSITTEIIPKIRAVQPTASLEDALKVTLKDPQLTFFNALPNGAKRLAILANTEPDLAIMLEKLLYNTNQLETKLGKKIAHQTIAIDPALSAKLQKTLEGIPIPNPSNSILGTVRGKIVDEVNELLGKNLNIAEIRKLDPILEQQGTRGSVFEHWVRTNFVDPHGTITSLSGKTPPFDNVKGAAGTAKNVQIDSHMVLTKGQQQILIGMEIKHVAGKLTGEPLQQLYRYKELVNNPAAYKSAGVTYNQIQIRYLFSDVVGANANKALIRAELGPNAIIYYVNQSGQIVVLP